VIHSRKGVLRAFGALLGACALGVGMGATAAHADPVQNHFEAVVRAYDGRGNEVPATVTASVGGSVVTTVTIDSPDGQVVTTSATNLSQFVAAIEAGAGDGDTLDPDITSVTSVAVGENGEPDRALESLSGTMVYDWDGDFVADLSTVTTIERGYNDRFVVFVETNLYELGIGVGPGPGYEPRYDCGVYAFPCISGGLWPPTFAMPATQRAATVTASKAVGVVPMAAPKFVADREGKDFATYANRYLFHYKVEVANDGTVTIGPSGRTGPLPLDQERTQRALVEVIEKLIKDGAKVTFIRGNASKDPSDARVAGGSYTQSKIDLDDLEALGGGLGLTGIATLVHELEEQYQKQVKGKAFDAAHAEAIKAELVVVGARTRDQLPAERKGAKTIVSFVHTYPDGKVIHTVITIEAGKFTSVERVDRTPRR
jgi:hypothetical protein